MDNELERLNGFSEPEVLQQGYLSAKDLLTLRRAMRGLIDDELVQLYVPLSGSRDGNRRQIQGSVPQSTQRRIERSSPTEHEISDHKDILEVIQPNTRALLLGSPGAGKTLALLKVLQRDLDLEFTPLWVKLNHWLDGSMSFVDFVAQEIPIVGTIWEKIANGGKCRLFLDGLNELPAEHRPVQLRQISQWLDDNRLASVLISCRDGDAPTDRLGNIRERLIISPFRPTQIRRFVHNYAEFGHVASPDAAESFFWELMGGPVVEKIWNSRPNDTADSVLDDLVDDRPNYSASWISTEDQIEFGKIKNSPLWLYPVSRNPYFLAMLVWVWCDDAPGRTDTPAPRHRVDILDMYTRERLQDEIDKELAHISVDDVQQTLTRLAETMQRVAEGSSSGREVGALALRVNDVDATDFRYLDVAIAARILRREGNLLRFSHQLLLEFYVAKFLHEKLIDGGAALLNFVWGGQSSLWERSGWEQPFLLLAQYQHTDVIDLMRILTEIQPEVAGKVWAQTFDIQPSLLSLQFSQEIFTRMAEQMRPKVPSRDFPRREAAYGRGLGLMKSLGGAPMDARKGIFGHFDLASRKAKIDIDWVHIPAGPYMYQGQRRINLQGFYASRHLVSDCQFRAFVEDPNGWNNLRWWKGVPLSEQARKWEPFSIHSNHPCTEVSWWMAQVFCRWLSAVLGVRVVLPKEIQWERMATGSSGNPYPAFGNWEGDGVFSRNVLGRASAPCGLFAEAVTAENLFDMSGNVFQWNSTPFRSDEAYPLLRHWVWDRWQKDAPRVIRGGTFLDTEKSRDRRADSRVPAPPDQRSPAIGFRVITGQRPPRR